MLDTKGIIDTYISFFENREHTRIANSPLIPENDPTTLFTSAGMQPLIPYLLGEPHPSGKRLVNVQNSFRAQDIDEVGDNRHTTFFRMLGNWSLGDYFKKEEIPWLWEFLTKELGLPKDKLYVTVFAGNPDVEFDHDAEKIWKEIFESEGLEPKIFKDKTNWWSRSGMPDKMPSGEPGGPDTEVYFRFNDEQVKHTPQCKDDPTGCECGKFLEIANSVFMQYQKSDDGTLKLLPNPNVDFGGGLERILAAVENKSDIFQTSLFSPIIEEITRQTQKDYRQYSKQIRIIADHLTGAVFITASGVYPSNKERGYILRRLIRRALDSYSVLGGGEFEKIIEVIVGQYRKTDEILVEKYEEIKGVILEEENKYKTARKNATDFIVKKYGKDDDSTSPAREISAGDAFLLYSTHGLSPTQIKSLGFSFNDQDFANLMKEHQKTSRAGAQQKFAGGLADSKEKTIMGHTATHLLHQALRDVLGSGIHQSGSNITEERLRFDFDFARSLTDEEIRKVETIINEKIKANLPVRFEIMPLSKAKELGAIGLFDEKYQDNVKVYFIGDYSKEFCGGPHVDFTGKLKRVTIIKQENIGKGLRRIYAKVGE